MKLSDPLKIDGFGFDTEDAITQRSIMFLARGDGKGYGFYYGELTTNMDTDDWGNGGGHDYSSTSDMGSGDGSGTPTWIMGSPLKEGYPSEW